MGVLAAQVAKAAGGRVIVVGTPADAERLQLIATLGMETSSTGDPDDVARLAALGESRAIDVVVECAGVGAAVSNGLRLVRPSGTFVQIGLLAGDVSIPFGDVVLKEIRVQATFASAPDSWLRVERLLENGLVGPRAARVRGAAARGVAARLRQCRGPGRDQDRPGSPTWRRSGGSLIGGSTAG